MRIGIVGAGAAGLAAGRRLAAAGHEIVIYEKSRGVGGRAATRRTHGCTFDHGAQYLKTPDDLPEVARLALEELPRDGLRDIRRPVWTFDKRNHIGEGDPQSNAAPKWTYAEGLTTLGKLLGAGLDVRLETRVTRLERVPSGYRLRDTAGTSLGEVDRVLVTVPAPQAIDLLEGSAIDPRRADAARTALAGARYQPMYTALLGYAAPPAGMVFAGGAPGDPRPYYALINTDRGHDVSWLAFENDKGPERAPAGTLALVAQMAVPFSEAHDDAQPDRVAALAAELVGGLLGGALARPIWHDLARWRYAKPERTVDPATLNRDHDGLFFTGDYTTGWRLHLALQAGLDVAKSLAENA